MEYSSVPPPLGWALLRPTAEGVLLDGPVRPENRAEFEKLKEGDAAGTRKPTATTTVPRGKPSALIHFPVKREPGFLVKRMLATLGLLTTLGFGSFVIPINDPGTRLEYMIAVIFTVITLRISMPSENTYKHMTAMDAYHWACTLLLALMGWVHAMLSGVLIMSTSSEEYEDDHEYTAKRVNAGICGVALLLWAGFNARFFYGLLFLSAWGQATELMEPAEADGFVTWGAEWLGDDATADHTALPADHALFQQALHRAAVVAVATKRFSSIVSKSKNK